ncbi:MAG: hypothetical protein IJE25_01065 [Clostridia bacterium]|nr:hypothetical protein [Clostridia bacterium]
MTFQDKIKLNRFFETVSDNYRITRIYAEYLERYPELIKAEMVDALTEDGDISREEAIVALLSEAFALDFSKAEDRRLIMNYLTPSVRMLDPQKYINNPYYKNIRIENIRRGGWELKNECYPAYRGVIAADMILAEDHKEIPPLGFFAEDFHFPAVLEGGNEWMTLTPVDLDTCEDAIKAAHGKVVTYGLGLGYYAYMVSMKEEVRSITVVERSEEVIKLFSDYILPQFKKKDKVRVVCADAFDYAERVSPKEGFDLAFVDTWRDASDGEPMYRRMKPLEKLSPNTKFMYWIENFLISRSRALKLDKLREKLDGGADDAPCSFDEFISEYKKI